MVKKTTYLSGVRRSFGVMVLLLALSVPCHAAVIFEDNFDSDPDWNTAGQHEGQACITSQSVCAATDYPSGYTFFRSVPYSTGYNPVAQITHLPSSLSDHTTGSTTGKAFIVTNESMSTTTPFPSDGMIGKFFGFSAAYPELYVRFWARTQPGYQTLPGSQSKLLRFGSWDGRLDAFSWDYPQAPALFWDWSTYSSPAVADWVPAYRCDNSSNTYYCSSSVNSYQRNDYMQNWTNSTNTVNNPTSQSAGGFADGTWHRYDFHVKYNSAPGVADGVFEFMLDGVQMVGNKSSTGSYPATNVVFRESGSTKTGFNIFAIGGNSNNKYDTSAGIHQQWYAIDDLVVSTTAIPSNYVIGSGTTAPAAPLNLKGTGTP